MRILVISNFYPPHYVGGYELGCRDIVEGLRARGRDVAVLTSTYGVSGPRREGEVYRWLRLEVVSSDGLARPPVPRPAVPRLVRQELTNQRAFRRLCRAFRPDVVYAWNLAQLSPSVVYTAERLRLPVAYFVSDPWLSAWERLPWYALCAYRPQGRGLRLAWWACRQLLRAAALLPPTRLPDLRAAQFASQYLKGAALRAGLPVAAARVIHWGIDPEAFPFRRPARSAARLLYLGQVVGHKGVHTAVAALKHLIEQYGHRSATLTIAGGSVTPAYVRTLRETVASLGLEDRVTFTGLVPRAAVPSICQRHDVLVFPSIWDEPFSITVLEAMASGLAVVGTATGGSPEILEDGRNALIFPAEDAGACAAQISRLLHDPSLLEEIQRNGRRTIEERFTLPTMLDEIELALAAATGSLGGSEPRRRSDVPDVVEG